MRIPQYSSKTWTTPTSDYSGEPVLDSTGNPAKDANGEDITKGGSRYPYNHATQTESGHSFEMDYTPGYERVRLQHRSGTFLEMQADSSQVNHIDRDSFKVVVGNDYVKISGICHVTIEGDSMVEVKGNKFEKIHGDYMLQIDGDYEVMSRGDYHCTSSGKFAMQAGSGEIEMTAFDKISLNADLAIDGHFSAASIYSTSSITAGTGIHAGVPGSDPENEEGWLAGISTFGSFYAGFPGSGVPIPGMVNAAMFVNAGLGFNTPGELTVGAAGLIGGALGVGGAATIGGFLGVGGAATVGGLVLGSQVSDAQGTMSAMRALYNIHTHPAPMGMTGLPTVMML